MKFFTDSAHVQYRWDLVCSSVFRRYPNPWSKHVLSDDVISREVQGPILKTIRVIMKTNKLPSVFASLVTLKNGFVVEESHVNRETKTIVTYTRNLTHTSFMTLHERCEYTISPESNNWTLLKRQAWINSGVYGLARTVEAFGTDRYRKNIKKSLKGLEYIIQKMHIPEKHLNRIPLPHMAHMGQKM